MTHIMKNFVLNKVTKCRLGRGFLALLLCLCMIICSITGCSGDRSIQQKGFVVSKEKNITQTILPEHHVREELIKERHYDEEQITDDGIHQFFYGEELICETYIIEAVVGTTDIDEVNKELSSAIDVEIDWKLAFKEFAVGTSLIIIAGVVGGILGPSTYFVSVSAAEGLQTAIIGGMVNSIINVVYNGVKDKGLTSKSFTKYAIEGFSEGYMFAAFCSAADTVIKNVVRYVKFNDEYGSYYSIKKDGSVYDLSGQKVGTGYYQDGNIIINKEYRTSKNIASAESTYSANSIFETSDGNKCYTDDVGKIYRINNELLANTSYKIKNVTYITDSKGRICKVEFTDLKLKSEGRKRLGIIDTMEDIGKGDAIDGDHRGHLIADLFDGDNSLANIVPMSANANLKDVKNIENIWKQNLLAGKKVSGEITIKYTSNSFRPTSFIYSYRIDGGEKIVEQILN